MAYADRTWRQTLNRIEFLVENPCEANFAVYAETFLPAAGNAILVLLTPTPEEILEEYLDPKAGRKKPRRKFRGKPRRMRARGRFHRRRWPGGFPDPDGSIAKRIPGASFFNGRKGTLPEQIFWRGINVADRFLWYWLVIDVTDDLIYNWSSGIMESRFCQAGIDCSWDAEVKPELLPSTGSNIRCQDMHVITAKNAECAGDVYQPSIGSANVFFYCEAVYQNVGDQPGENWFHFQVTEADGTEAIVAGQNTIEPGQTVTESQLGQFSEFDHWEGFARVRDPDIRLVSFNMQFFGILNPIE